jgi:DeoR/GlpR family transcriptional regulator of sugar metabolism
MLPFERYELILDACRKSGPISINELLRLTGSSLTTLRRDINHLSTKGALQKLRGGVSCVGRPEQRGNFSYEHRGMLFRREKEAIGVAAQQFIQDGDILVLSYGTTCIQVARHIDEDKHVTLLTNGIDILFELRNKPNVTVIVLGGIVDFSNRTIEGPTVPKTLHEFNPSKIIIGAGGITEEKGLTNYEFLSSTYVKEMVKLVKDVIVVADHSKFGRIVLTNMMPLKDVSAIVTDSGISPKFVKVFRKYGIKYKVAKVKGPK